jgi:hypothetical protein
MNALQWHLHQWGRRLGTTGAVGLGFLAVAAAADDESAPCAGKHAQHES